MHKEVTGLAEKLIALVIGISLFFSNTFILLAFGDTVLPIYWVPALNTGYVSGAEVGSLSSWGWFMSTLCSSARLYCATQQHLTSLQHTTEGPDGVFPICPVPQLLLSAEELARHWDGPFFSSTGAPVPRRVKLYWVWKENRTVDKAVWDALGLCLEPLLMVFTENPDSSSWL